MKHSLEGGGNLSLITRIKIVRLIEQAKADNIC